MINWSPEAYSPTSRALFEDTEALVTETEEFVRALASDVPFLRPALDEHVLDNGEVLPYVLMGDFTRSILSRYHSYVAGDRQKSFEIHKALALLEGGLDGGRPDIRDLILTSFLENLEADDFDAIGLRSMFGPNLRLASRLPDR